MLHNEKKLAKIVEELTMFFFGIGGNDMSSSIKREGKTAVISFKSNYSKELAYKLDSMEDFLNGQKNDGMEDIYWELVGSGDPGESSQLLLIGMMIDKAIIDKQEDCVLIQLEKYIG